MRHIKTIMPYGMQGREITVEVASSKSLPTIEIIGLPDSAVKESKERLRAAFRACGIDIPPRKYTINLAPSEERKTGTMIDLAIAVGLFCAICETPKGEITDMLRFGELGLDGTIKGTSHVFAGVVAGKEHGYKKCVVPQESSDDVSHIFGIQCLGVRHFREVVAYIITGKNLEQIDYKPQVIIKQPSFDAFLAIQGQREAKRALAIAAAGRHHILLIGPPGSGKSLLAKALRELLLPMNDEESTTVLHIHSLAGEGKKEKREYSQRPFRTVHPSGSKVALLGGGYNAAPGEISLAHKGVLFFDELGEFPRDTLDSLRQPLEEKEIIISRATRNIVYPAQCLFVCAMNPCACGYYGDREKMCTCSQRAVQRYQQKISGPLLDRIDLVVGVKREKIAFLDTPSGACSKEKKKSDAEEMHTIQQGIIRAVAFQEKRFLGTPYRTNSDILPQHIEHYIPLDAACRSVLTIAIEKLVLSLRAIHKAIKVARTIADFDGVDHVQKEHILEALHYREHGWFSER